MVVSRGERARLQILPLLATAVALATAVGCATPWAKSANEAELPIAESQAPKVYSKAIPSGTSSELPARSVPSQADQRMAREIERLTTLNDQLSKTIAQSASSSAARPQPSQPAAVPPIRKASQSAVSQALQSEFIELAAPQSAGATKGPAQLSFSDDGDAPAEQAPAPIVERSPPAAEAKMEAPKTSIAPTAATEAKPSAYRAGAWLTARDEVIAQLQEEIAAAKSDKTRAAEVAHLETLLRMYYALAGRRDDAVRPVKELREPEQEFWRSEALGLADLLGTDRLANESRRYAVALKSLEEAEAHLAAASSLTLRNIALCRKVQDFGVIERFKSNDFTRNQEVLLYVEVRNFTAKQKDDHQYETELQGSFRVLDRGGVSRAERTLPLDKQSCANPRRDYYIAYRLYIPTELAPGSYTLELTIEDKKGEKSNNALLDFNVAQ